MFQFSQSLLDFSENFDLVKPEVYDVPTTTHNSPGSYKTKSVSFEDSPFNCSFDEGSQSNHANAVWNASVNFLTSALDEFIDTARGFNDDSID